MVVRRRPAESLLAEGHQRFLRDLATAYDLPVSREQIARLQGTTYTMLVQDLTSDLAGDGDPVGLVLLAHAAPDGHLRWPACYLAEHLPGSPVAFAVADQGRTAGFMALRICADLAPAHEVTRAIVIVLEQPAVLLSETPGAGPPVPKRNQAVALVFDARRGRVGTRVSVEPSSQEDATSALRRAMDGAGDDTLIVVGSGVVPAGATGSRRVVLADPGLPCSGVWLSVAEGLAAWQAAGFRRVLVLDYDPVARSLGSCTIELA